jgi:hypothetical protein
MEISDFSTIVSKLERLEVRARLKAVHGKVVA